MNQALIDDFVNYCKNKIDFNNNIFPNYGSLSVCIIDCVYSLRANYKLVTERVVQNYANIYMNGNPEDNQDTLSNLINRIESKTAEIFAKETLENEQKSGGVLKSEICPKLAKYLRAIGIETIEDFRKFQNKSEKPEESEELLEIIIRSVKGIGNAGTNYLFMLAGDTGRCKPDVHMRKCIKNVCGEDLKDDEYQELFTEAVILLNKNNSNKQLTVRDLDHAIWVKYSKVG